MRSFQSKDTKSETMEVSVLYLVMQPPIFLETIIAFTKNYMDKKGD